MSTVCWACMSCTVHHAVVTLPLKPYQLCYFSCNWISCNSKSFEIIIGGMRRWVITWCVMSTEGLSSSITENSKKLLDNLPGCWFCEVSSYFLMVSNLYLMHKILQGNFIQEHYAKTRYIGWHHFKQLKQSKTQLSVAASVDWIRES